MRTTFGKELAKIRLEIGESQGAMALGLGMTQACLSRIETGLQKPNISILFAIICKYDVSYDCKNKLVKAFYNCSHSDDLFLTISNLDINKFEAITQFIDLVNKVPNDRVDELVNIVKNFKEA